jgi:hypothetical protein
MSQGPRCVCLMEKSGGRKSRDTVPLKPKLFEFIALFGREQS